MDKQKIQEIIKKLLNEVDEEDIGISLLTTYQQNNKELGFFSERDREKVLRIVKKLSDDSRRHKKILEEIISELSEKLDEQ